MCKTVSVYISIKRWLLLRSEWVKWREDKFLDRIPILCVYALNVCMCVCVCLWYSIISLRNLQTQCQESVAVCRNDVESLSMKQSSVCMRALIRGRAHCKHSHTLTRCCKFICWNVSSLAGCGSVAPNSSWLCGAARHRADIQVFLGITSEAADWPAPRRPWERERGRQQSKPEMKTNSPKNHIEQMYLHWWILMHEKTMEWLKNTQCPLLYICNNV